MVVQIEMLLQRKTLKFSDSSKLQGRIAAHKHLICSLKTIDIPGAGPANTTSSSDRSTTSRSMNYNWSFLIRSEGIFWSSDPAFSVSTSLTSILACYPTLFAWPTSRNFFFRHVDDVNVSSAIYIITGFSFILAVYDSQPKNHDIVTSYVFGCNSLQRRRRRLVIEACR